MLATLSRSYMTAVRLDPFELAPAAFKRAIPHGLPLPALNRPGFGSSPRRPSLVSALYDAGKAIWLKHRTRVELRALDSHLLRDIGVNRDGIKIVPNRAARSPSA